MRVGLVYEKKSDYPLDSSDPAYANSDLLSEFEEDELIAGLRDAGHDVIRIGDGRQLLADAAGWRSRCDLVFNRSVGYRGVDRKSLVPGVLEIAEIPYVGSGAYVASLTRHKFHAKQIVAAAGLPTAPARSWMDERDTAGLADLAYPAIVKPVAESCSIGIDQRSIVSTPEAALARARWVVERFGQPAIVEGFVRGLEVEVPLLGWPELRALGVIALTMGGASVRGDHILTSDRVYGDDYGFADDLEGVDVERTLATAEAIGRALGIRDYGRVDFRITDEGTPMFIEATTHPHILKHSSFHFVARGRGLGYSAMLDEILDVARRRIG